MRSMLILFGCVVFLEALVPAHAAYRSIGNEFKSDSIEFEYIDECSDIQDEIRSVKTAIRALNVDILKLSEQLHKAREACGWFTKVFVDPLCDATIRNLTNVLEITQRLLRREEALLEDLMDELAACQANE